ncbi:MAG: EAL domain-containing protein [Burkholderiaceae bacterium]
MTASPASPPMPQRWADSLRVYRSADGAAAEIRARHLQEMVALTPLAVGIGLLDGMLLIAGLGEFGLANGSLWWFAALTSLSMLVLARWRHQRNRRTGRASVRAMRRASLYATIFALIWCVPPLLWVPMADPWQQMMIALVTLGVIGGGAYLLSSVPRASLSLVAVLGTAATVTLLLSTNPLRVWLLALLATYLVVVTVTTLWMSVVATARLVSERRASHQEQVVGLLLRDFETHYPIALCELDPRGCLRHVSDKLASLLRMPVAQLDGRPLSNLLEPPAGAICKPPGQAGETLPLAQWFAQGRPFRDVLLVQHAPAGPRWWSLTATPVFDDAGHLRHWQGVVADVTGEQVAQERLERLALHDTLTGLPNRLQLRERLTGILATPGRQAALLCLDLDNFKTINDSLGHSVGDAVLQAVAERLRDTARPQDLVVRLGGDEFAVLLDEPLVGADAFALAQRLLDTLDAPCVARGHSLRMSASVGVALLPEHGAQFDEALGNADLALYAAKAQGRTRWAAFQPMLAERNHRRRKIEQGLRHALTRDELSLDWQLQVDIDDWSLAGAEALLRWQHTELGSVGPDEFIPVAEESGLIIELGRWALRQACLQAVEQLSLRKVSVNVSPAQLMNADFVTVVRHALAESGLQPQRLELEITESLFLDASPTAVQTLHALKRLGVGIALDDFGTGYSSLAYLRRFPFDTLKIDRGFVGELSQRGDALAIVHTIIELARKLGMDTVAEGVEEPAQLEVLARAGCGAMQGYLAARPMPLPTLTAECLRWTTADRPQFSNA